MHERQLRQNEDMRRILNYRLTRPEREDRRQAQSNDLGYSQGVRGIVSSRQIGTRRIDGRHLACGDAGSVRRNER